METEDRLISLSARNLDIIHDVDNYREINQESVDALATSILEVGIQEPITVIEEEVGYSLINGFHRLHAVRKLTKSHPHLEITIPVIVAPQGSDIAVRRVVSNSIRFDSAIGKAQGAALLRDSKNMPPKQIAEVLGQTRPTIDNWLNLSDLYNAAPELVKKASDIGKDAALYRVAAKYARDRDINIEKEIQKIMAVKKKTEKPTQTKLWEDILSKEGLNKDTVSSIIAKAKKAKLI
jgi:ParB/RepB/Spo0J family partition protein